MTITSYNKSLSGDFPNGIHEGQLMREIEIDGTISQRISNCVTSGDTVTISFENALTAEEQTTLNTIIAAHIPFEPKTTSSLTMIATRIKNRSYTDVISFFYEGTNHTSPIVKVFAVTKGGNYSIRIYDTINNNVLIEETYTNENYETKEISTVNNLPAEKTLLEVQMKKNSGSNPFIKTIQVVFD